MFFKYFITVQKFGSKEKRLHHMVEQKRHIGIIITKTFSPFLPKFLMTSWKQATKKDSLNDIIDFRIM